MYYVNTNNGSNYLSIIQTAAVQSALTFDLYLDLIALLNYVKLRS